MVRTREPGPASTRTWSTAVEEHSTLQRRRSGWATSPWCRVHLQESIDNKLGAASSSSATEHVREGPARSLPRRPPLAASHRAPASLPLPPSSPAKPARPAAPALSLPSAPSLHPHAHPPPCSPSLSPLPSPPPIASHAAPQRRFASRLSLSLFLPTPNTPLRQPTPRAGPFPLSRGATRPSPAVATSTLLFRRCAQRRPRFPTRAASALFSRPQGPL
ncbi:hypothetical protein Taro_035998, partial [Colocasia esculenta]|nr:hypothetical protein [Colocasia esculenta]